MPSLPESTDFAVCILDFDYKLRELLLMHSCEYWFQLICVSWDQFLQPKQAAVNVKIITNSKYTHAYAFDCRRRATISYTYQTERVPFWAKSAHIDMLATDNDNTFDTYVFVDGFSRAIQVPSQFSPFLHCRPTPFTLLFLSSPLPRTYLSLFSWPLH